MLIRGVAASSSGLQRVKLIVLILMMLTMSYLITRREAISSHYLPSGESLPAYAGEMAASLRNVPFLGNSVLGNKFKLLCFVITCPQNLDTKAIYVKKTWGSRCDKTIYISEVQNDTFPTIKVCDPPEKNPHSFLWRKTRNTLELLYKEYMDEFDWFMKADDDTYVFVNNLRRFLRDKDPETNMEFYGKAFNLTGKVYNSGGGGYVFGKGALRRVVEGGLRNNSSGRCPKAESIGSEDVFMGECFKVSGVTTSEESLDGDGRELFHALKFAHEVDPRRWPTWYREMSIHPMLPGRQLSSHFITFHYVQGIEMVAMDYLLHNVTSET